MAPRTYQGLFLRDVVYLTYHIDAFFSQVRGDPACCVGSSSTASVSTAAPASTAVLCPAVRSRSGFGGNSPSLRFEESPISSLRGWL